jgi:hypothetical protein
MKENLNMMGHELYDRIELVFIACEMALNFHQMQFNDEIIEIIYFLDELVVNR